MHAHRIAHQPQLCEFFGLLVAAWSPKPKLVIVVKEKPEVPRKSKSRKSRTTEIIVPPHPEGSMPVRSPAPERAV